MKVPADRYYILPEQKVTEVGIIEKDLKKVVGLQTDSGGRENNGSFWY